MRALGIRKSLNIQAWVNADFALIDDGYAVQILYSIQRRPPSISGASVFCVLEIKFSIFDSPEPIDLNKYRTGLSNVHK